MTTQLSGTMTRREMFESMAHLAIGGLCFAIIVCALALIL